MVRLNRCAASVLLLLATALVGSSPASAGKPFNKPGVKPGGKPEANVPKDGGTLEPASPATPAPPPASPGVETPKDGVAPSAPPTTASPAPGGKLVRPDVHIPKDGGVLDPGPKPPAPPEPKGWPHSILTGSTTNCARNPLPYEVIVYRDSTFTGQCAVLVPGFYPYAANFLVGNDAISAIKVGSDVRARMFKDPVFAGDWNTYAPGTVTGGLGGFNDKVSSIRVEPAKRSMLCDDLREGEIALFENQYLRGDCVVLPGDESFANAENMGIENDSISSMRNNSSRRLIGYWHPSFSQGGFEVPPHAKVDKLPTDGFLTEGINDNISSIQTAQ